MRSAKTNFLFVFLALFLGVGTLFSQQKEIVGQIKNTKDIEGVHILNISSRFNAVTNAEGRFSIKARAKDTLLVSAIAYVPELFIVSEEIFEQGYLDIILKDLVNELDEVKVGNQLTGNLTVDTHKIETEDSKVLDLSFKKMEFDYEFTPDKYSSTKGDVAQEAFFNGQKQNDGVKFQEIIPAIFKFFRGKKAPPKLPRQEVFNLLRDKFSDQEIEAQLGIPAVNATAFIYFVVEEGVDEELLKKNNELSLLQFLMNQVLSYNAQRKK